MQRYSEEVKRFITEKVVGRSSEELAALVNERFGLIVTSNQIQSFKKNHGLQSGTAKGKGPGSSLIFTKEMQKFIRDHVQGRTAESLTEMLNQTFNTDYKVTQLRAYKKNHKIQSGIDCKFTLGCVSHNKGKKGQYAPGCEVSWFKKGALPHNHKPIGSERIDIKDGYTLIKTAEPNVWEHKHKYLYESAHGKIQDDQMVIFLDGDKTNITLDNLHAVLMAESLELTRSKLRFSDADLTRTGILIVKIKRLKFDKRRKLERSNR